jgi:7-carboxy-7-deazaguanine synthase
MNKYNVVEKFASINGEGKKSGQLAVFIRLAGCNLRCSYCDTMWANEDNAPYEVMTSEEIYNYIKDSGINNVTLTGGEPLMQENIKELLLFLSKDNNLDVEIETNGSVDIREFLDISQNPPRFTMDYKLPGSNMECNMYLENLKNLRTFDTVKFVASNLDDLNKAKKIITKYDLANKCSVYISPVFGSINPEDIVEFMKDNKMNNVNLQIQLHKIIWDPQKKGV